MNTAEQFAAFLKDGGLDVDPARVAEMSALCDELVPAREYWPELIRRHAEGRAICNCGKAYLTNNGFCQIRDEADPRGYREIHDDPQCDGGCSWAQHEAREHVAKKILGIQ